jgi:hypothetical protein
MASTMVMAGALWVWAAPVLAAGDGERVGRNVGNLLGGWARSLFVGIAGIVALMFLFNRRFADLAIFAFAAVVVGGFVMAPGDVSSTIRDIWNSITA